MEKTIVITRDDYNKAVAKTTAKIMADHGKDHPDATLMFSLASIAFSISLELELFGPDKDEDTEDPHSMREELDNFCQNMVCGECPLNTDEFICGRAHYFTVLPGDPDAYMDDKVIAKHYKKMKEYKNER